MAGSYLPGWAPPVPGQTLHPAPTVPPSTADPRGGVPVAAPPGYTWDSVKGHWVPIVGGAANAAAINDKLLGTFGPIGTSGTGSGGAGFPAPIPPPSLRGLMAAGPGGGVMPGSGVSTSATGSAHLAPVDTTAAESAAFGHAKDQVGLESSGALTGLQAALGSRGLLGSGLEERGTASVVNAGAAQLGDVSRQAAVTKANLAQENAKTNLHEDVTQRGQDFQREEAGNTLAGSLAETGYRGQVEQRGQDIQSSSDAQRFALGQAQLAIQQRATSLAGLEAALKSTASPAGLY